MAESKLFEAALGVEAPWFVSGTEFDGGRRQLTIKIDFVAGSRFTHPDVPGAHPVHDTQTKRYRHLNFFQHDCFLEVRVPRLKLPDGRVALIQPDWAGKLSGFTLLFEALVLTLCQQMPFAAVARLVGESWHRVHAICSRYVDLAVDAVDLSSVTALAIDETSYRRGHHYLTLAADANRRSVVFVTPGRGSDTLGRLAEHLEAHQASPEQIESVSIDMSPAYIRGVAESFRAGGKLLLFGNGGSAADAQHIAAELTGRFRGERDALPAIALAANSSDVTALGNDYGFDRVFARLVSAYGRPGDVALAISTSGNSPNVLEAVREARSRGLRTIGLTGRRGGKLAPAVDVAIVVPSDDTQRIQEAHIAVGHVLCELVEEELFAARG